MDSTESPPKTRRSVTMVDSSGRVTVSVSDLSTNRSAYKYDTECSICKNSAWTVFNPKKYCKFCYRSVCKDCASQYVYHPERAKEERCCSACYNRFISQSALYEMQSKLKEEDGRIKSANELLQAAKGTRNVDSAKLQTLREQLKKLTEDLETEKEILEIQVANVSKTIAPLQESVNSAQSALASQKEILNELQSQFNAIESSLSSEESSAAFFAERLSQAKSDLTASQDEFARLRQMMNERQVGALSETVFENHYNESDLQIIIEHLREQQAGLNRENVAVGNELRDNIEREYQKQQMVTLSGNDQDIAEYCQLRQEIDHLKREIERHSGSASEQRDQVVLKLRRELEKLKTENEELKGMMGKPQDSRRQPREKLDRLV